jgi:hypothetical protein
MQASRTADTNTTTMCELKNKEALQLNNQGVEHLMEGQITESFRCLRRALTILKNECLADDSSCNGMEPKTVVYEPMSESVMSQVKGISLESSSFFVYDHPFTVSKQDKADLTIPNICPEDSAILVVFNLALVCHYKSFLGMDAACAKKAENLYDLCCAMVENGRINDCLVFSVLARNNKAALFCDQGNFAGAQEVLKEIPDFAKATVAHSQMLNEMDVGGILLNMFWCQGNVAGAGAA